MSTAKEPGVAGATSGVAWTRSSRTVSAAKQPGFALGCPLPAGAPAQVLLGHGSGGKLMGDLVEHLFLPAFGNESLEERHDGAVVECGDRRLAFSTDSYVVNPLFFPGGDIGSLAVFGTVNDLAMCGARPLYLSCGFILEEGLPLETLGRVVHSMREAAHRAGVQVVTGDTKVVDRGKGDQLFVNTAGIGLVESATPVAPRSVRPGDAVLLSGDIGRHGMAVMAVREGLEFESPIESDSCCVAGMVRDLLDAGIQVHCLRDLTRGGLASALVEIAETTRLPIEIDESSVPVDDRVRGACEILGLDPQYVANEGRFIAFVPPDQAGAALHVMQSHRPGARASRIGEVGPRAPGIVTARSPLGTRRVIDRLSGEQLPRIC